MKALSLFANVGIGEYYLHELGVNVVVANELEEDRADFYRKLYPESNMICGDITSPEVYDKILQASQGVDLIIATPPCQGMSVANARRADKDDPRNSLIKRVVDFINDLNPKYVLVENVRGMAKTFINHNGSPVNIMDYIKSNISDEYSLDHKVLDSADFNTPQHRKRLITLISRAGEWKHPEPLKNKITVREAIGHLPSIESGEKSGLLWHEGKNHNADHIQWMKHTPTNKTAFDNPVHFPKVTDKETGVVRPIKGFKTTYKRIDWDKPSPTITMCNGAISSQNNVHPGTKQSDGTYSDARVLSVRELSLLTGLPDDWLDNLPDLKENFVRKVIGECFPPKMSYHVVKQII